MSLEILDCCGNQLTNLDISKNLELKELRCSNNKLTSIDVSNCALLEDLRCDYNHLGGLDVSTCAALKRLECDYSKLSRLDVRNCTALESLNCEGNPLGDLDVSQNSLLKTLNCQFNQLSSVDVRQNTILESLFCGNNQLRSLDVSQNAKLKKLGCNNNRLNSLDISQNSMLEGLSCQVNPLSSLDVSHNPSLKDLYCYYIALSDLDVSNNLELEHLSCEKNDLSSLHVGQNLALKTLDCSENQLRTLDVTRNLVLMDLRCSENQLKSLDVSSCLELQALWCENNQLKSLDTSKNLKLTSLKDKPQNVSQDEGKQFITVPRYFITKTIEDQDFSLGAVLTVGDGKLSYESDNPDTATISVDGTVAIHGAGTAVITITAAATEDYEEATKKVTIAVNGKNEPAVNPDTEKLGNPKLTPGAPATWDCVWFGHYPQSSDGNGGFKKEPIKWRVLSVEGDEALLLADKNLDSKPYNEAEAAVTWETSTIRSWLNGYDGSRNLDGKDYTNDNFMGKAFTTEERAAINQKTVHTPQNPEHETDGGKDTEDKLFFLSIQEATNPAYGFADSPSDHTMTRRALNTDYSNPQGKATYRGLGSWWLRSPGQTSWFVIDVKGIGDANLEGRYHRPSSRYYCDYNSLVRPALRLNLKSNLWSYAGTVSSDGKADEIKQGTGNATASVQNPTPLGGVDEATWDCVWLGHYPQSSDKKGDFKEEPIKWRVLSVDGNEALLLADKILDHKRYNETETCVMNWEKSTVRSWLNGYGSSANKNKTDYGDDSFLGAAFTSEEQAAIKEKTVRNPKNAQYDVDGGNDTEDKVFLLSIEEAMNPAYGFASDGDENSKTRRTANTAYAKSHGAYTDKSKEYAGNGWWWLRSPGNYASYAATVWYDGIVHQSGSGFVSTTHESVRPALRLDLHSNVWSYAGTVSSDGTVNEVPAKMASDPTDLTTEEPESKPTGPATAPTTDQPATESTQPATQEPPATEPVQPPAAAGDEGQNTKPPTASKPQKPKAVALKKVSSTKKGALKLTWKKDTKATGYQAMVATDKKFKKNKKTAVIKKNKTVTKTFTKLKRKKTYYAKVRAYKQVGKTKVYGAYSKVKKAKVK
ncbi:hypothetical protein D3Z38_09750 [Clostridiales bacterium]|nr:hypothetical protein [Clostridiales bacterium]